MKPELCTHLLLISLAITAPPSAGAMPDVAVKDSGPRTADGIDGPALRRLGQAFPIAVSMLRKDATCRRLFEDLGANGVKTLRNTVFLPASSPAARRICGSNVMAFTAVASPATRICHRFSILTPVRAAHILIHEALHSAGLGERPLDPSGMTSKQINLLVTKNCG